MKKFEKLGLCEHVLKVISAKKFEKPSEIQEKTIPLIMDGKDVIAGSATGSGKTLAFGAGIIKNTDKNGKINGLILTPTRELAEQVAGAMEEFSYYKNLEVVSVYGGVSISNQIKKLAYADIVVATPGRLLDHLQHNSVDLSNVNFLVLDEADRMWDMGFKDDVAKIVKSCPKNRQTLLFSATINSELADFSGKYMKAPVEISVDSYVDASLLKQVYYDVADGQKFSLLVHLLKNEDAHLIMIFCNTRRNVDFVAKNLALNGINAQAIHGGMEQNKRQRVLKSFDSNKRNIFTNLKRKAGACNVLVCTDVAARGLDIQGVSHVYNYDIASDARDYVHRIGRTARAGESGIAINILASRDYDNFANVQKHNPEIYIERVMTPRFEKIFVKMEEGRRRGLHGRAARGGNFRGSRVGGSRGSRRDSRESSRRHKSGGSSPRRDSRGHSIVGSDGRGRQDRGDSNKRYKDGFRGSGRNTRPKRNRW